MKQTHKAAASVILAGVFWGIISIPVKAQARIGLDAMQISAIRMAVAAICFFLLIALTKPRLLKIRLRDCWIFLCTGFISVGMCNMLYSYTMLQSGAAISVVLMYTSPIFIMLMSALFFRERIIGRKVLALVLSIAGCVLVTGLIGSGNPISFPVLLPGLGSGLAYALYTIFGRVALKKYDAVTVTVYTFIVGAVGLLPLADLGGAVSLMQADPSLIAWCVGGSVFCAVVPYFLYTWGLQRMESGKAAILACIEPLVGSVIGMTLWGESHEIGKLIGILLILAAITLLSLQQKTEKEEIR